MTTETYRLRSGGPNCQIWNTAFSLTDQACEAARKNEPLDHPGPFMEIAARELFAIPGVTHVFVKSYEMTVFKAELFHWEAIDACVGRLLREISTAE